MEISNMLDSESLAKLIVEAKKLAIEYRRLTGRPLGITGEIAEWEAARLLNLRLAMVRQSGFDAIDENDRRLQIKSRCILENSKPGQRLGGIKLEKEWDDVLLVILDESYEPVIIYEASRSAITDALLAPGSRARNERGALAVSKFKSIGKVVWNRIKSK